MAKTVLLGAAAATVMLELATAGAVSAQQPAGPLAPAFGNTLASTYPDGRVSKLWLAPDGTFEGMNRKGQPNAGRWTVSGERLCMKQSKPFPFPISYCTPVPPPGETMAGWKAKAPTGEPITVRLVKGRS